MRTQRIHFAMLTGSLLLSAMMPITLANAQALEEIVVTARQRSENLSDVPASITAFTKDTIEATGIKRAEDFIAITPGVSMVNTADVGDTSLSIRGLNGARDAETNFAFIIDGILYTNPSAFNREYSALNQIEILKGPQGALYGRSAASGAVIVTTNKPSDDPEASINLSYGNHATFITKGLIGGAIKENELYGRLSFDYRETDGHLSNNLTGNDSVNNFENYNIEGRLVWEPTENLSLDAKLRYGEVVGSSIAFNAAFALPSFQAFLGPDAFKDVNDHEFVFSPNVPTENEQETTEISLKLDYEMKGATLTSWVLYSNIEQYFIADGTSASFSFYNNEPYCISSTAALAGFPVQSPAFIGATPASSDSLFPPYSPTGCDGYQLQQRDQEDISVEVRLTSNNNDGALRWNVGFYLLDLTRKWGDGTYLDDGRDDRPIALINPLVDNLKLDGFDTTVYSIFGAINYDLSSSVEASFALRWDREERDVENLVPIPSQRTTTRIDYCANLTVGLCTLNGSPLVGSPLNPAFVTDFATGVVVDAIPSRSKVFSKLQPKVSLTWDIAEDWTAFGSWGIGFKSGGFNNTGSSSTIQNFLVTPGAAFNSELVAPPDLFQEETSSAFEIGFKAQLAGGRLNLNGAAFYTEIENMQFFEFFVGPFGLLRVVENIEEASLWGAELGVAAKVSNSLTLNAGVSVIEGEIDKNPLRPNTVGNNIPNAPDLTFNASALWRPRLTETINFVAYMDYSLVGETWFHTVQDDIVPATLFAGPPADFSRAVRDAYGIVNLRLGFEGVKWSANLFANNLTDEEFLAEVIQAPEFGGSFVHPGTDRIIGVEFTYRFF